MYGGSIAVLDRFRPACLGELLARFFFSVSLTGYDPRPKTLRWPPSSFRAPGFEVLGLQGFAVWGLPGLRVSGFGVLEASFAKPDIPSSKTTNSNLEGTATH